MPSKFVSCPLCGQGFGSASIGIHVPQCYDKALKRWQLDPRGPKPVMPSRGLSTGTMKESSMSRAPSTLPAYGPTPTRVPLNQQQQQFMLPSEHPQGNPNLHPCRKCKRTFAFDRIAYHESVCKGADKKRKTFNSTKQRLSGFDEFEVRAARGGGGGGVRGGRGVSLRNAPVDTRPSGASSWRRQHADFIAAIRSAKTYQNQVKGMQRNQAPQGPTGRQPRQPYNATALRNPDTFRSSTVRGHVGASSGALGPRQVPQFPARTSVKSTPAGSGRGAVTAARSMGGGGFGGPSSAGAYQGGAPNYRILNTNQTSSAMLQAMGRI